MRIILFFPFVLEGFRVLGSAGSRRVFAGDLSTALVVSEQREATISVSADAI